MPQDAAEIFSDYLNYWMKERGLDSRAVVKKARGKYGVLSDATMHNFLSAKPAEMMVGTVEALAYAIRRPPEEVFLAKIGRWKRPSSKDEFQSSELAYLEQLLSEMPNGESKRFVTRLLRIAEREIEETAGQTDRR